MSGARAPSLLPPDWWWLNAQLFWRELTASGADAWLLARWMGQCFGVAALLWAADWLLGAAILHAAGVRLPARLRGAAILAVGMAASATTLFLLAWRRKLLWGWIFGAAILGALAGLRLLRTRRGRWFVLAPLRALRPPGWAWLFLPGLLLFGADLLFPVFEYDATMYHMGAARWYEDTHRLAYHGGIRFNAQPHLPVLLFARAAMLLGEDQAKLVQPQFLLMLVFAIAHLAHRRRTSPAWGLLLMAAAPVFWWVARVEYVDLPLGAWFGTAAALVASSAPVWVAAIALGAAAATKLQGVVMASLLGLSFLIVYRDWRRTMHLALGVIALGLPWWLRSYLATGSPAYPFFLPAGSPGSSDATYLFRVSAVYGLGRDWRALVALPWNAIVEPAHRFADVFPMGPPLAVVALAGLLAAVARRRPSRATWLWLLTGGGFFLFWFFTGQVMRYLSSLLPVLAFLTVAAAAALRWRRVWLIPLAAWSAVAIILPSTSIRFRTPPPVRLGDRERFLIGHLPYYRAARALNQISHPYQRTYLWFCEDARYHVRTYSSGDWFGDRNYAWVGAAGKQTAELVARLRDSGYDYVIVSRERARKAAGLYAPDFAGSGFVVPGGPVPDGVQQIYTDGIDYDVWRLRAAPAGAAGSAAERVRDAGRARGEASRAGAGRSDSRKGDGG